MNILVFGAGAIGCHIAFCLYETGHNVYLVSRGKHYEAMSDQGMNIKICDNEVLKEEHTIYHGDRFQILNSIDQVGDVEFDYVFITVKLADYNEQNLNLLEPYMGEDTAVISPCTKMPFWWFYNLDNKPEYKDIDFDHEISRFFKKENIIMMTMWLSTVIESPGHVVIKHVQRGYPLGAVYSKMGNKANKLREIFAETCMSPTVTDIRSEIFFKSINSMAFNAIALDREFNNLQLSQDKESQEDIKKIMIEGEEILNVLDIPIIQDVDDRIRQTLSSTKHTMSMLHDYRCGKSIELSYIWEGFYRIADVLDIKMDFTKSIVDKVLAKTNI